MVARRGNRGPEHNKLGIMGKAYSYIFNDSSTLSFICGTNNENILLLETLLGNPIFPVENQLRYLSNDASSVEMFKNLCNLMVDAIVQKIELTPDFIKSAFVQLSGQKLETEDIQKEQEDTSVQSQKIPMIYIPITQKKIFPKTKGQSKVLESLQSNDISFLIGPAGTGKTFLATAFALEQLLSKKKEKYIITRPVVEAGEKLGYLPGDLEQKILPYLRPIYDVLYDLGDETIIHLLQEKKQIEIAPLAYMRGRTLVNSVVLLDEAQNCTPAQMKMLLTRLGEGTVCIVNGDLEQSDLPVKSGLAQAISVFKNTSHINIVTLTEEDIQRSRIARIVIEAYNRYEGKS